MQRETERLRGLDSLLTLQKAVEDLELKSDINKRWTPSDLEWSAAIKKLHLRDFQKACDKLEGLVVSRCMEFTKMHQSEIGKHCLFY
jgi:hypothetical protein